MCASLTDQLKAQVIVQRRLDRKVAERSWVVHPEDLVFRPRGDAATATAAGTPRDAAVGAGLASWRPPWARAGDDDGGEIETSATEDDDDEGEADRDGEYRD